MAPKSRRNTGQKNTFRFDPKKQEPIASTSKNTPDPSSHSDEAIVAETFQPKQTPPENVLDKDEYVPIEDDDTMETDTHDFIIIPCLTPFAYASLISKTTKDLPTQTIIKTINNHFAPLDEFKGV